MRTEKQQEASRANGRRSQGPVIPEGKQRASQNALRHGLLAKTVVLQHENRENFQFYLDQHVDRFQPADDVEMNVVEEMVSASWRLRRTWAIQTSLLDTEVATHFDEEIPAAVAGSFAKLAAEPAIALLLRYETRLHLVYHRCINTLTRLRATRPARPAEPVMPNEPNQAEQSEATQPQHLTPNPCFPVPCQTNPSQPSPIPSPSIPSLSPTPRLEFPTPHLNRSFHTPS